MQKSIDLKEEELHFRLLRILDGSPDISQRELARDMQISLGKVNFCIRALIKKGLIKASNFKNSQNKIAYLYHLTPSGIEAKAKLTMKFLKIKMVEYDLIKKEIEELKKNVHDLTKHDLKKSAVL